MHDAVSGSSDGNRVVPTLIQVFRIRNNHSCTCSISEIFLAWAFTFAHNMQTRASSLERSTCKDSSSVHKIEGDTLLFEACMGLR